MKWFGAAVLPQTALMRWKCLVAVGAVSVAALSSAGCTPASGGGSPAWVSGAQAAADYQKEAARLVLAPGWSWPSVAQQYPETSDGDSVQYGVNTGRVDASFYWMCSWSRSYFAADQGPDKQADLVQIGRLTESAFFQVGLAAQDRPGLERALTRLQHGDDAEFRRMVDSNCPAAPEG